MEAEGLITFGGVCAVELVAHEEDGGLYWGSGGGLRRADVEGRSLLQIVIGEEVVVVSQVVVGGIAARDRANTAPIPNRPTERL